MRELRGRVPWYGALANHAGIVLPAIAGGLIVAVARRQFGAEADGAVQTFAGAVVGASVYWAINLLISSTIVAIRTNARLRDVLGGDSGIYTNMLTLAPLAWLMAQMYVIAWWAALLFTIPLYTTRVAYHRFVEMREMFTQTIEALAGAVDARDPYTSSHSRNVKTMAVDIGRAMRVSAAGIEALEWGGLLHDVGKIGVKDAVLLKPDRLNREERAEMNAHPTTGARIIEPVTKLAPVVPIILHHHEWFNGSGYPKRLVGLEIPELARILAVADAFEAMTHARPYRMKPLTPQEALAELRRYAGIQFDPEMVEAFARTEWVRGVADPGRPNDPRPVPLLREAAERMTAAVPVPAEPGATPAENT
jgi:HD-GYP domain-containing protein (c-di-GMP phosphodiesterase class II)